MKPRYFLFGGNGELPGQSEDQIQNLGPWDIYEDKGWYEDSMVPPAAQYPKSIK
jgi:hypothetical protein